MGWETTENNLYIVFCYLKFINIKIYNLVC